MINVTHILPVAGVGGMEQLLLTLCKYRNRTRFNYIVITPDDGVIMEEIRETGTPVYTGWQNLPSVMRWANIINLHWAYYEAKLYSMVQNSGKPFITTLHWANEMPDLPVITICTSLHTYDIQKDKSRFVAITNGVDLSRFTPHPKKQREEVILTRVCRPSKCALYFWQAMYKVLELYPNTKLWIVGNEKGYGKSTERIKFLGIRRDVPEVLAETDIFVYTPYPNDGSKDLVVMEALAMGVPCVVSDGIAVRESVENGKTGFLVPYGNVDAFVEKVGTLVKDAELRYSMGQTAIQFAKENFDMQSITGRYEALYEKVLGF